MGGTVMQTGKMENFKRRAVSRGGINDKRRKKALNPLSKNAAAVGRGVKYAEGAVPLTPEEQQQLAKDVNEMFEIDGDNPTNERARARAFAFWCFAKAFVADEDRVEHEGGRRVDIRVESLSQMRQRQLQNAVHFFLKCAKEDQKATNEIGETKKTDDSC